MGRKKIDPLELKIPVKLRLKRELREKSLTLNINLSQLLEDALIKELKKREKESK